MPYALKVTMATSTATLTSELTNVQFSATYFTSAHFDGFSPNSLGVFKLVYSFL